VGIEMEVEEGETVLNAAFRQASRLCMAARKDNVAAASQQLIDGDIELLKYSTFALPDYESEPNHVLLCRTATPTAMSVSNCSTTTRTCSAVRSR